MILLLGATGYVGQAYQAYLGKNGIPHTPLSRRDADYTQPAILRDYLKANRPTFLINAAGYTGKPNVDACEIHKTECLQGNATFPGTVREVCESLDISWGHVSSGCIYTGKKADGSGFSETDKPNFSFRQGNCSWYSGTKALGEEILEGAENCYVWRLRIPFDNRDNPRNYLTKLLRYEKLLDAENSVSHLQEFVAVTYQTWEKGLEPGVYNVTNPGSITTRQVTEWIEESGIAPGKSYQFFESEDNFLKTAAKTPRSNCTMDTSKLRATGIPIRPVELAIKDALANWQTQP
jgi:dTDP-4-dehydrorhamnose reductase